MRRTVNAQETEKAVLFEPSINMYWLFAKVGREHGNKIWQRKAANINEMHFMA